MSRPIEFETILINNCSFDATARIPESGAILIAQASGTDASDGNWTGIRVTVTNLDTGATQSLSARSDSAKVELPVVVKEEGRYRVQAVQSNFRETCESTSVAGRTLVRGFFD